MRPQQCRRWVLENLKALQLRFYMNFPHLNPLWLPLLVGSDFVEGALLISLFCRPNQSKSLKKNQARCSSWPICETSKSWWVFIFHCFLDWSNASQTANERMYHDAKENVFSTHPIVIHLARIATINATMKMYSHAGDRLIHRQFRMVFFLPMFIHSCD